jgi:hypothetical protein
MSSIPLRSSEKWELEWRRKQMLIGRKGWTSRYGCSFEAAIFPTNAWECDAEDDCAIAHGRRLGNMHNLHFEIREAL